MSLRSKKSKTEEEQIEITFIRSDPIPWPHEDSKFKEITTIFEEKEKKKPTPCTSYSSLHVHYDSDSTLSELSFISNFNESKEDVYRKRSTKSSRPRSKKRTRIEPTILNHFLDFLSVCFWKCSTGCQQIPDKQ